MVTRTSSRFRPRPKRLSSDTLEISNAYLGIGTYSISASYSGDNAHFSSGSPASTLIIDREIATTGLASSNPSVFGQSVTLTATVRGPRGAARSPRGSVLFTDGATTLRAAGRSVDRVTYTTTSLAVGDHSITAWSSGDGNYLPNVSAFTQHVNRASTVIELTALPNPSSFGQQVTFTAAVSVAWPGAGTPTGEVVFKDGDITLGTSVVASGVASLSISSLEVGTHTISAAYEGNSNFVGSTSDALTQTILTRLPLKPRSSPRQIRACSESRLSSPLPFYLFRRAPPHRRAA